MPGGRPSNITTVVAHDPNTGADITVADRIVNGLRAGAYFEQCAAAAGVHKETAYGWLRIAGQARIRAKGAGLDSIDLTDHEQACVAFSDSVAEAEAGWELGALATLERLGRGDIEQTTVIVEADAQGIVLKRSTRTTRTLPDARVLLWRLERKHRDRYGRPADLERNPPGETLTHDERVDNVASTFTSYLQGVADAEAAAAAEAKPGPAAKVTRPRKARARKPPTS